MKGGGQSELTRLLTHRPIPGNRASLGPSRNHAQTLLAHSPVRGDMGRTGRPTARKTNLQRRPTSWRQRRGERERRPFGCFPTRLPSGRTNDGNMHMTIQQSPFGGAYRRRRLGEAGREWRVTTRSSPTERREMEAHRDPGPTREARGETSRGAQPSGRGPQNMQGTRDR